ncbi:MAG: diguanylate cyclase [Deltaproteobacteria bacterium]|nr:diguanylate cyclase [Deltaproteobacteria bacterium]
MPRWREDEIIATASEHGRPAVFVCVNLQNFKPFNILLGHQRGDQFLERVQQRLTEIGRSWRTGGDEFVTLAGGKLTAVTEQVSAFTWLFHVTIGATEAWSFRFDDQRKAAIVPWRSFQVVCTPRCGFAELGSDVSGSLHLARRQCDDIRQTDPDALRPSFAPLATGPWTNEKKLATPICPACGDGQPIVIEDDLGWSRERCARCDASYERINVLSVFGEESEAGYM